MRYLIWDFDGTLAYRQGTWGDSMLDLLREAAPRLRVSRDDLKPHLATGFPWHSPGHVHPELDTPQKWWDALYPVFERAFAAVGVEPALASGLAVRVREAYADPERWRVYEDALPVLDELSSRGWTHLVLSNHVPELSEIAENVGLSSRISRIFNSAESGHEKPHPEAYRGVLRTLKQTEAIWMIGDNADADVAGAEAAGIPAILVRGYREEVRYCCEGLPQVVDIVERRQG